MRFRWLFHKTLALCFACAFPQCAFSQGEGRSTARAWQPEDIQAFAPLAKVQIAPLMVFAEDAPHDRQVHFSPDGGYFFFTQSWIEAETDTNFTQLSVFRASDVVVRLRTSTSIRPLWTTRFFSSRGFGGISDARWDEDSTAIIFLGDTIEQRSQIFRLSISNGEVRALSDQPTDLENARFSYRAGTLIWSEQVRRKSRPIAYPMEPIRREIDGGAWASASNPQGIDLLYAKLPGKPAIALPQYTGTLLRPLISPDGRSVIFSSYGRVGEAARTGEHFVILDLVTGAFTAIEDVKSDPVTLVRWINAGAILASFGGPDNRRSIFQKETTRWAWRDVIGSEAVVAPKPDSKLDISVQQDSKTIPTIVASSGSRSITLETGAPRLAGVKIARSKIVRWREPGGIVAEGLLTLPADVEFGRRLPLIIQVYKHFEASKSLAQFLPEGPSNGSIYATQSLAARGFAVLDLAPVEEKNTTIRPRFIERIDAAVDELKRQGIIDGDRVALSSFYDAGYSASYALTHPGKTRLAAAAIDHFDPATYATYVAWGGLRGTPPGFENNYLGMGAGSFWQNPDAWRREEFSFNVDKILTPTMVSQAFGDAPNDGDGTVDPYQSRPVREIVGSYRLNRRPLEYLIFPKGTWPLSRPRERLALTHSVVDWYCFWLKGEMPSDPERATRWKQIKDDWEAQKTWEAAGHPVGSKPEMAQP